MEEEQRRKLKQLQSLFDSPIWKLVYEPTVEKMKNATFMQLRNRSESRRKSAPDDYLWGAYDTLDWLLNWPKQEVKQALLDFQTEILARREEEGYDLDDSGNDTP